VNETTQAGTTAAPEPPKRAPKTFQQTLQDINYGYTADELTAALHECIGESERTGKATELTFKLKIKPVSKANGRYNIGTEVTTKLPPKEREDALMFVGPDGNLTNRDPRQKELPGMRVIDGPSTANRLEGDNPAPAVRVS
jgi:hypothetical protein